MCNHKIVLAIYKEGQPHTKKNISHFRCVKCGTTEVLRFGREIIYASKEGV